MKEVFFTFVAISLPLLALGGVIYMLLHGLYTVYGDWRLRRELQQLKADAKQLRRDHPPKSPPKDFDPLIAFSDEPPRAESKGLLTIPLEPLSARAPTPPAPDWVTDDPSADSQSTAIPPDLPHDRQALPANRPRAAASFGPETALNHPLQVQPVESEPVESEPVESEPVESEPVESEPGQEESAEDMVRSRVSAVETDVEQQPNDESPSDVVAHDRSVDPAVGSTDPHPQEDVDVRSLSDPVRTDKPASLLSEADDRDADAAQPDDPVTDHRPTNVTMPHGLTFDPHQISGVIELSDEQPRGPSQRGNPATQQAAPDDPVAAKLDSHASRSDVVEEDLGKGAARTDEAEHLEGAQEDSTGGPGDVDRADRT